ncbi:MAG TPA: hypothetical protein ENK05_08155 [Gammaproteobacteria bacterium]|nr:hypothetical protein [Gammaproteobacteria bacterium]
MKADTKRALRSLLLLLLWLPLAAPAESQAPREYEIELLVFQDLRADDGGEVWPVDYSQWFEDEQTPSADEQGATQVTWLPPAAYHLAAEKNALARSRRYRPLAYFAWRQPVLDRRHALPLRLPAERHGDSDAWVDGRVRVAVERYLHLYLDLKLHLPYSAEQLDQLDGEVPEIRLRERRRMRSGELHYFDNPRFGIIALITPVGEDKADSGGNY